jgi:DNA-binding NtrC family response regulator
MPGLTGFDLSKAILAIRPEMPIIMCTGHSATVSKDKALALGIKQYVYKPLQADELLLAVQEVLGAESTD